MTQKMAKVLFWGILILSVACIVILELTEFRPLGSANNADGINNILLALSYSLVAACIFYFLNDWLPMRYRRRVASAYVNREMRQLREQLRLCTLMLHPFAFIHITDMPKEEFLNVAGQKDLTGPSLIRSKTILDQLNHYREKIIEISESLLSSYYGVMSDEQIKFVSDMLNSSFVANGIMPIKHDVPKEYRDSFPDNQREVCEDIYDKYTEIERLIVGKSSERKKSPK